MIKFLFPLMLFTSCASLSSIPSKTPDSILADAHTALDSLYRSCDPSFLDSIDSLYNVLYHAVSHSADKDLYMAEMQEIVRTSNHFYEKCQ